MAAPTKDRRVVANAIVEWLTADTSLGLERVFYGEESLIVITPSVAVMPGPVTRELVGTQYRTQNTFNIILSIYHGRQGTPGLTRQSADELAEDVENRLHQNRNLDGLVVHGFVSSIDGGYLSVGEDFYVGTQLTWTGISLTHLGG